MKLFKKLRKGFTLIELVVVIAVIAILAAVSVVSYVSITNKAKESNDHMMIDQINLSVEGSSIPSRKATVYEVLEDLKEDAGFGVEKLTPELKDAEFVYSYSMNKFAYWKKDKVVYPKDVAESSSATGEDLWFFKDVQSPANLAEGHSYYIKSAPANATITVDGGIDVGSQSFSSITYANNSSAKEVVIRTNGGTLFVGSSSSVAKGRVSHYGTLTEAVVYTEDHSFHTSGAIGSLKLKAGKTVAEPGSIVYLTEAASSVSIEVENNSVVLIPSSTTTADVPVSIAESIGYTVPSAASDYSGATKETGSNYKIKTSDDLKKFRDFANSAFDFSGLIVELDGDINLSGESWEPIGNKKVPFAGTFDGKNHKIKYLSNGSFAYDSSYAMTTDSAKIHGYSYGFFGVIGSNTNNEAPVTIRNVKFENVNINVPGANMCGGVVGADVYAVKSNENFAGAITIQNVSVEGEIKAPDAVGSIAGKIYTKGSLTVENCTNTSSIVILQSENSESGKAGGLVGFYAKGSLIVKNCINKGSMTGVGHKIFAGIASTSNNVVSVTILSCQYLDGTITNAGSTFAAISYMQDNASRRTTTIEGVESNSTNKAGYELHRVK